MLNGNNVEELGTIVHASKAVNVGRKMVLKLLDMIPRQQFQVNNFNNFKFINYKFNI